MAADGSEIDNDVSCEERFKPYKQFGLIYDTSKNELQYNGRVVRWFEDYYTVVDVHAVRDFSSPVRAEDGSLDPSGKLVGVAEFLAEEFAARDIEAIKNPPPIVAITGDPLFAKELEDMAKEHKTSGVTYDVENDQWYFNGEKVRYF